MLRMRKREKDPDVRDRIMLNVLVERDGMTAAGAALHLGMSRRGASSGAADTWMKAGWDCRPAPGREGRRGFRGRAWRRYGRR